MTTWPILPVTHRLPQTGVSGRTTAAAEGVGEGRTTGRPEGPAAAPTPPPAGALPAREGRPCPAACPAAVNGRRARGAGRAPPPQHSPAAAPVRRRQDPALPWWRTPPGPRQRGAGKLCPHRPALGSAGSPGPGASAGGSVALPTGSAEAEAARRSAEAPGSGRTPRQTPCAGREESRGPPDCHGVSSPILLPCLFQESCSSLRHQKP